MFDVCPKSFAFAGLLRIVFFKCFAQVVPVGSPELSLNFSTQLFVLLFQFLCASLAHFLEDSVSLPNEATKGSADPWLGFFGSSLFVGDVVFYSCLYFISDEGP